MRTLAINKISATALRAFAACATGAAPAAGDAAPVRRPIKIAMFGTLTAPVRSFGMTSQSVKTLRDMKKDKPGAANNRRKYPSSMFGWAIEQTPAFMKSNPVRDVRRIKYESEGFHTWTAAEFEQFEKRHPARRHIWRWRYSFTQALAAATWSRSESRT